MCGELRDELALEVARLGGVEDHAELRQSAREFGVGVVGVGGAHGGEDGVGTHDRAVEEHAAVGLQRDVRPVRAGGDGVDGKLDLGAEGEGARQEAPDSRRAAEEVVALGVEVEHDGARAHEAHRGDAEAREVVEACADDDHHAVDPVVARADVGLFERAGGDVDDGRDGGDVLAVPLGAQVGGVRAQQEAALRPARGRAGEDGGVERARRGALRARRGDGDLERRPEPHEARVPPRRVGRLEAVLEHHGDARRAHRRDEGRVAHFGPAALFAGLLPLSEARAPRPLEAELVGGDEARELGRAHARVDAGHVEQPLGDDVAHAGACHADCERRDERAFVADGLAVEGERHDPYGARADVDHRHVRAEVGELAQRLVAVPHGAQDGVVVLRLDEAEGVHEETRAELIARVAEPRHGVLVRERGHARAGARDEVEVHARLRAVDAPAEEEVRARGLELAARACAERLDRVPVGREVRELGSAADGLRDDAHLSVGRLEVDPVGYGLVDGREDDAAGANAHRRAAEPAVGHGRRRVEAAVPFGLGAQVRLGRALVAEHADLYRVHVFCEEKKLWLFFGQLFWVAFLEGWGRGCSFYFFFFFFFFFFFDFFKIIFF